MTSQTDHLEHLHIVHVALPVLDVASVVPGHHPNVVVGPLHRPHLHQVHIKQDLDECVENKYRTVVSLKDGFKIECEAVPQGELTAASTWTFEIKR